MSFLNPFGKKNPPQEGNPPPNVQKTPTTTPPKKDLEQKTGTLFTGVQLLNQGQVATFGILAVAGVTAGTAGLAIPVAASIMVVSSIALHLYAQNKKLRDILLQITQMTKQIHDTMTKIRDIAQLKNQGKSPEVFKIDIGPTIEALNQIDNRIEQIAGKDTIKIINEQLKINPRTIIDSLKSTETILNQEQLESVATEEEKKQIEQKQEKQILKQLQSKSKFFGRMKNILAPGINISDIDRDLVKLGVQFSVLASNFSIELQRLNDSRIDEILNQPEKSSDQIVIEEQKNIQTKLEEELTKEENSNPPIGGRKTRRKRRKINKRKRRTVKNNVF